MKFKKLFLLLLPLNLLSSEIPAYSAKYNFESDEITITGIREYKKGEEGKWNPPMLLEACYNAHSELLITKRPAISFLISTCPAFASFTALAISFVTVPNLGFGISPFGPNIFPNFDNLTIIEGVQISFSKLKSPFLIVSIKSSPPTISAFAVLAS